MAKSHLKEVKMILESYSPSLYKYHGKTMGDEIHFNPEFSEINEKELAGFVSLERPVVLIVEDQKDVREYITM